MSAVPVLVSHALCPYVQRAAILLLEKGVAFERRDVDLARKPAWFLDVSPLGKTPVLLVDGAPVFESAVICEYLDETAGPRLHPADPLTRAQHRSWMAFGSSVLDGIGVLYAAKGAEALTQATRVLRQRFEQLEATLGRGPYFDGPAFRVVDAVFAPAFRYFDVIDAIDGFDARSLWNGLAKVQAWRRALAARPSVGAAVDTGYPARLAEFLRARDSELGRLARAAAGHTAAPAVATP